MKALFCTDGSEISFYSLTNLKSYTHNLEIDILCVIDWHFYPMYMASPEQDFANTYEEIADGILQLAQNEIEKMGYKTGKLIKSWGSASSEIIKLLKEHQYDMVILGSHGKKGLQNWLGSVSTQVVNSSIDPVFISKQVLENRKVLFAIDGTKNSNYILKESIKLLRLQDKEIYLATVMDDISAFPIEITSNQDWFKDYLKKRECFAKNTLSESKYLLKENDLFVKKEFLLTGAPSNKLIELINDEKMDLTILGSHSKDKFSEFLLGSTSKRILEKVKSSVLIISLRKNNSN